MCVTIDCGFEFPFLARNKMFIIIIFIAKVGMPTSNGILEILTRGVPIWVFGMY